MSDVLITAGVGVRIPHDPPEKVSDSGLRLFFVSGVGTEKGQKEEYKLLDIIHIIRKEFSA